MEKKHCTAVVLAAGKGTRMGTSVAKQYLKIGGHPVAAYALEAFERSPLIDDIVLMTGEGQQEYCERELVQHYGWKKVKKICVGGRERYESVWKAIEILQKDSEIGNRVGYVFIHDGARPFVGEEILQQALQTVQACGACVAAVPSKDTVKIVNEEGLIVDTPDRSKVWIVQTPQVFEYALIRRAYDKLMNGPHAQVTDDAMAVELMENHPVKVTKGSYYNIKITTPEDMMLAKAYVQARSLS